VAAKSTLGEALRFLRQRGFEPIASGGSVRTLEGSLRIKAEDVPVRIEISDWEFVTYPKLTLLSRPAFFPSRLSHIDAVGGLCYLTPGSVVLDRYDPAGSIALCLQSAESVLNDIIADPQRNERAVEDEFLAYWGGGSKHGLALIGEVPSASKIADVYVIDTDEQRAKISFPIICAEVKEATQIARALGGTVRLGSAARCWLASTDRYPVAPPNGLPTSVRSLFEYLKHWDPRLSQQVQRILATEKQYLQRSLVTFAVRSPAGWLGFSFSIDAFRKAKGHRQLPKVCLQYLHRRGESIEIRRLSIMEVGAKFIHSRNLNHASLIDKRVTIVGCGAIGGYLAQAFARLGAGAGRGELRLIDPGILEPGNLGRHWLGMDALFAPKASAVARALRAQFPMSNFVECENDVGEVANLFDADLIIDATGIEAISEMINAKHMHLTADRPPVLYTWVLGNGECVEGLWVDAARFGCYRCLRQPDGSNYRAERFPVLREPPRTSRVGCQAVTPYAVVSPMAAAALATEFVIDWLKGSASPRLRHRFQPNAEVHHPKDQDMSRVAQCPACTVH